MKTAELIGTPLSSEWTWDVPASEGCEMARLRLEARGYRLSEPVQEVTGGVCRLTMSHERTLGVRRRMSGKIMLLAAVALTLVLLVMMARDIGGERLIVSGPLLVAVLLGGLGMNRLRAPLRHERRIVEVTVSPTTDGGCRAAVNGETLSGPMAVTDDPPTAAEVGAAQEALQEDVRAVEGSSVATEDAP